VAHRHARCYRERPALPPPLFRDAYYESWRRRIFDPVSEAAGPAEATPYTLRHSFASLLVQTGWNALEIAHEMGNSPEVVQRDYSHLSASSPAVSASIRSRSSPARDPSCCNRDALALQLIHRSCRSPIAVPPRGELRQRRRPRRPRHRSRDRRSVEHGAGMAAGNRTPTGDRARRSAGVRARRVTDHLSVDVVTVAIDGVWWRQVPHAADPLFRADPPNDRRWQRGATVGALYFADSEETARRVVPGPGRACDPARPADTPRPVAMVPRRRNDNLTARPGRDIRPVPKNVTPQPLPQTRCTVCNRHTARHATTTSF